tara:strand:- start:8288 stop:8899 length:612 start_codon:yes stop_codon:yes gene_type:complete
MTLKIIVPPHPFIGHWLTMLRDASTPKALYSTGLEQLGKWLTYEALREWLPYRSQEVETDLGKTEGTIIETRVPLLVIPNLPGGLALWQGAKELLPNATLCLGGIPNDIEINSGLIIYMDEITTGDLLLKELIQLKEQEIDSKRIRIISALVSNPGLKKIGESFSDLTIYSACIDPEITKEGNIYPGIGKPALRINTRIEGNN